MVFVCVYFMARRISQLKNIMRKNHLIILVLVLVLSALLQVLYLDSKGLSYDEVSSIAHAEKSFNFTAQPFYRYKPVYTFLFKAWIWLFGCSALAVRLLTVLFGVGSVLLIYILASRLLSEDCGLIAAFLLSTSCFFIYHTQQANYNIFLLFLVLLSYIYLLYFLSGYSVKGAIGNVFVNLLVVYTHPYGFLAVFSQALFIILARKKIGEGIFKKWLYWQALFLPAALFSLYFIFLSNDFARAILWWAKMPNLSNIKETFETFSYGGPRYGMEDVSFMTCPTPLGITTTVIFLFLFINGIIAFFKYKNRIKLSSSLTLLLCWLIIPILAVIIFSYIFFPAYFIKRFIIVLPAFYLIVASGIGLGRQPKKTVIVVICIGMLSIVPLKIMYQHDNVVDWRNAVSWVKSHGMRQDDTFLIATCKEILPFLYYLDEGDKCIFKDISMYGRLQGSRWSPEFYFNNYYIIGMASEQPNINEKDRGSPKNKNCYSCDYLLAEFKGRVLLGEALKRKKRIWLLISRWASFTGECLNSAVAQMPASYKLKYRQDISGVEIFCYDFTN